MVVKLIFQMYIEGQGATLIKNELNNLGFKSKKGNLWTQSTVIGIIRNEKYKGDILLGKTFTVDPISKRRLDNLGEEDRYYIHNHHEPIITEEMFNRVQEERSRRSNVEIGEDGTRQRKSTKYSAKRQ